MNLPNLITLCRIALAPVMLLLAWRGFEHTFLACLVASLVSDIVDGQIARRMNLTSEFGSRLDSWADILTCATLPLAAWWLRPDLVATERAAVLTAVASYAVPVIIGFIKFRSLTSYHTLMARISAYMVGASVVIMFAHGPTLPFRIAVGVLVLAELEEIAITLALPEARSNIRSVARALEIRGNSRSPS